MKYNNMSFEEIMESIEILYEKGMKVSQTMKLRKALRELSRDMFKNLGNYKRAIKLIYEDTEPESKPEKAKDKPIEKVVEEEIEEYYANTDF